jgi:hypothetical protein
VTTVANGILNYERLRQRQASHDFVGSRHRLPARGAITDSERAIHARQLWQTIVPEPFAGASVNPERRQPTLVITDLRALLDICGQSHPTPADAVGSASSSRDAFAAQ